ncbi:MAG: phosphatidylglycerophosphatase A [Gammaproteobacteria bacterium]|nr:phosphatidylglycerophosphatase A [Gammaproteobacteria bacterium]
MSDTQKLFFAKWISLGFGSGKIPVAPGTFGTMIGVLIYLLLSDINLYLYIAITVAFYFLGVWAAHLYSDHLGVHDHGSIVWDEVVGYMITMIAIPAQWQWILLGFILFRLFDIWKPWPIRWLDEKVHGGTGIMIDDVLAGIYAWVILFVTVNLFSI